METATRAEAELEALKREHEAKERARVAATERTARDAARARRDASSTIGTRGSVSVDDPRARGVVFPPNVVAADDDVGGERRREDEETPTRDADDADEETPIGPIEDELRAIRESSKPTTSSSADDRAPTLAIDPTRVRTISLNSPRACDGEGFLTEEECDHMLELSRGRMTKSGVVDIATGGSTTSDIRTSTGTFISRKRDDVIARIEKRIELWSHVPETHGEPFQVLRYQHGQEYKAHFDYFFHKSGMRNNRIATVLLYLSDVEEGGETVFPNTDAPTNRDASKFSECGNLGRGIKARKGDALLFWSMKPGGELDPGSSHAGCPVIKGEKWTATKWMHVNPLGAPGEDVHKIFYDGGPLPTPGCNDANEACAGWAQSGECDKNPGFMHKSCTMSCRLCRGHWRDGGTKSQAPPPRRRQTKTSHCLHTEYCTNNESCVARRTTRRHVVFFSVANRRRATKKMLNPRRKHCAPHTVARSQNTSSFVTTNANRHNKYGCHTNRTGTSVETYRACQTPCENVPRTARRRKINASVFPSTKPFLHVSKARSGRVTTCKRSTNATQ